MVRRTWASWATWWARSSPEGRGVEVDLEPFTTTPWDAERYGNVASSGAHLVVMAYDHEYDAPCAPITPYTWLQQVVAYAQSQVPGSDLTVGLPSYGYTTTTCSRVKHVTSNVAYVTIQNEPGFPTTPAAVESLPRSRAQERSVGIRTGCSTTTSMPPRSTPSSKLWRTWA